MATMYAYSHPYVLVVRLTTSGTAVALLPDMHDPADFSLRIEVAPPERIADDAATTRPFARSSAAELDDLDGLAELPAPRLPGVALPSLSLPPRATLASLRATPLTDVMAPPRPPALAFAPTPATMVMRAPEPTTNV
jgi:hypothetical protein